MKTPFTFFSGRLRVAVLFLSIPLVSCSALDPVVPGANGTGAKAVVGTASGLKPGKPNRSRYFGIKTDEPYVAMTFDDGPHPTHTPRLLDILRELDIKATFYVVGPRVKSHPGILRRMIAEGHEIGNHTWNHPNLARCSDSKVRSELKRTQDAVVAACGVKPNTMRAPFGSLKRSQREWIFKEFGYPSIMWAVDPEDWMRKNRKPSVVKANILKATDKGEIILAHDIHKSTVDAMKETLGELKARGFKFATVSQLFQLENDYLARQAKGPEGAAATESNS